MTINSFLSELKDELWDQVIISFNTNEICNLFLDTLIKHFEAVFPTVYTDRRNRQNNWISRGIRISCEKKRDLYTQCRNNRDNIQMARHYKKYCMILSKVIRGNPSRRCLHFEVVGGLERSNDPESYAGGSIATGRVSLAGQVEGDDPD